MSQNTVSLTGTCSPVHIFISSARDPFPLPLPPVGISLSTATHVDFQLSPEDPSRMQQSRHDKVISQVEDMLRGLDPSIRFPRDKIWSLITSDGDKEKFFWNPDRTVQTIYYGPDCRTSSDLSRSEVSRVLDALEARDSRADTTRTSHASRTEGSLPPSPSPEVLRRTELLAAAAGYIATQIHSSGTQSHGYTYATSDDVESIELEASTNQMGRETVTYWPSISQGIIQFQTQYGHVCTDMTRRELEVIHAVFRAEEAESGVDRQ